ncbi:phosphatidylserine/phosphatidylglycerophosphate/cardiolipin synthase family protein [Pararhodobacter sp. CCB-MM2]|uniref:phospholipase D-like domain-containing protein n=1 Tax=Pararhodobacter sp. CCB-MM2 TaxID=1786003 RepID=UPI0009F164E6|nr:phosphatidylserine/phosphatidylglycerophosphate/cardiolipin synthase family protein [Pararhodobacter sp. CCB-MM2]
MLARVTGLLFCALSALSACAALRSGPAPEQVPLVAPNPAGRHAVTTLILTDEGPAEGQTRAYVGAQGADRISLGFVARGRGAYTVEAQCDGPARVWRAASERDEARRLALAWVPAGTALRLRVEPGERHRSRMDLSPEVTRCDLTVTPGGRPAWSLTLLREDTALPRIAALDAPMPGCEGGGTDALTRAMMATGALSASCPMPAGETTLLVDGTDALNARVEALTGRRLSRAALEQADPDLPLDFSDAPQLDLIYVNYLNMNADFAGYLLTRMLAWHAERGTIVRLLVSEIMLTDTDRALFEGLAARYPTVQIQAYQMPARSAHGFEGQFARLHRVTHVKLFATVARTPGRSVAIIGGRNIHEGYFFPEPRDLDDFDFLHQYDPDEMRVTGGFTAYEDAELAFHGDAQVRRIVQQTGALWHRDHETQVMAPPAGLHPANPTEGAMRSFISVPYADGAALELWFARLIDAAQQRIRIASPYLNLPPLIEAAMERARARGVSVDVVATVRVREATDFMVTGLNRRFANRHGGWLHFYDYDPLPLLMHTKAIVIDDRLVVMGSVNLNQRSFLHDLENGVVILDRGFARQVDRLIQHYIDRAEPVPPGQPLAATMRFFSRMGFIERSF